MREIKKLLKEKAKAIECGQYKEAASACNAIGSEYYNQEKYEEALEEHLEELNYCKTISDQLGIAVANRKIGECYTMLNEFQKALNHVKEFYDISVGLKSLIEEQRALATLGWTYFLQYQHEYTSGKKTNSLSKTLDLAKYYYLKALNLLTSLRLELKPIEIAEMECRLMLNYGLVLEAEGDKKSSEKGKECIEKGLNIAKKNGFYEDICRCAYALGTTYQKLGKGHEADKVLQEALAATKKLDNKILTCEVLSSKGINLISLKKFDEAKECLKLAYNLHTTNIDDHEKIEKALRVCIGVESELKKLEKCTNKSERKKMFEKIADGLSEINCYKQAINYYHSSLDEIEDSCLSEKAPLYFSLAQTYLDDGNVPLALKYSEEEFRCNKGKPVEQIKTAWKMAEKFEDKKRFDESEKYYLKAVTLAEVAKDQKFIHSSLDKLMSFYYSVNKDELAEKTKKKLSGIEYTIGSDDDNEDEESQGPFDDIDISNLSDSSDEKEITTSRKRSKKIETKVNEKGETPLHKACIDGNLKMVKRFVESGHSVNVRDFAGWTPLHEACNHGFYDIVEYLLENGADINDPGGPDCKGITALHDAASCGNLDVMKLLISKGASVTALDENRETALDALLQWRKRSFDLDDVTLRECKAFENELRLKMAEAGITLNERVSDMACSSNSTSLSTTRFESPKTGGKRTRSPSLNSDDESDDYDIDDSPSYIKMSNDENLDDAKGAKHEYKSVMEQLRRSAASVKISSDKSQAPKTSNNPPLVDESEVVNEWLIKDTNNIPKTKRKKRRLNKLKVRTSKRIDDFLMNSDSADERETSNVVIEDSSNDSVTPVESHDKSVTGKDVSTPSSSKHESSKITFHLRVNIANKVIFVPIPNDSCTISWLQEEAATRYQNFYGKKPHLILTKDGALLSGTDLVKDIFSNNEEVSTSIEMWEEPSLEEIYVKLCNKSNEIVSSGARKRFQNVKTSNELDFSDCNIPSSQLNLIFNTIQNNKNLRHLSFSCTPLNHSNMPHLVNCIPSFTALVSLNLNCCGLFSESIEILIGYINDHLSENLLPSLKDLDLSNNIFSDSVDFSTFFKLNSLVSLNLTNCSLPSDFLSPTLLKSIKEKQNLEELNISQNNIFGSDNISNFLQHLPGQKLKKINLSQISAEEIELGSKLQTLLLTPVPYLTELILQGCFLTDIDLGHISESLSGCPMLKICNLSDNFSLSSHSLHSFFNKLYENNMNIIELNVIATCTWEDQQLNYLLDCLRLKSLKHFCFSNCSDTIAERMMQSWYEKWGERAMMCSNLFFCDLNVK